MSKEKADYITEALDLLHGEPAAIIEQPQSRMVLRESLGEEWTVAWVKLSTAFKPHIKKLRGAPLAVWLYIALSVNKSGVSFPSIARMSEDIGYSRQGIMDAIEVLEGKGYLKVRRGERRYNLYEPEFAAVGRTKEPSEATKTDESTKLTDSTDESSFLPNESSFLPNESTPLDLNKRNKKEQDLVDGILFYGKQAKDRREDKVEEVIQTLERGLRVNIVRSLNNQQIAKRILTDGRPLETWLTWVKADEWRAARLYIYADLEKVWRDYPQAFGESAGYNPQGLEIKL